MKDLAGKVAVVTGAASGIGRALARKFGEQQMKVVVADIESGPLEETAAELRAGGVESLGIRTDVSKADDVAALGEATLKEFGAVHVVCNNAGVLAAGLSWEATIEDYEWVIGVNLWGVIHGIRTFVPILLEQDTEGHIVNTASMAAVTTAAFTSVYYMTKHAVLSLSESLYHELTLRQAKIGVSALCPEAVATAIDRSERNRPPALRTSAKDTPEKEFVEQALRDQLEIATPPAVIADRVIDAIRENRFYVLSNDGWRDACNVRLEDIRLGRNPTFAVPGS
jgi:NAD(P)-dependent dehydrogenase (short-subunit alcohol dehydrogenase family)